AEAERAVSGNLFWREQMPAIKEQAEDFDRLYKEFRAQQTTYGGRVTKKDKDDLRDKLRAIGDTLDRFLAAEYGIDENHYPSEAAYNEKFAAWRASHQPFHWFVEFYGIVHVRGGFDVIIGNPPYVEWSKVKDYDVPLRLYQTRACGNLYTVVCERCYALLTGSGHFGMIVPISCVATSRMEELRALWRDGRIETYASHYSGDSHPSVLFQGVKFRLTILLQRKSPFSGSIYSTHFQRWLPEGRSNLFALIEYTALPHSIVRGGLVPKGSGPCHSNLLVRLCMTRQRIEQSVRPHASFQVYSHRIIAHFVKAMDFVPFFRNEREGEKKSEDYKIFPVESANLQNTLAALLNSSLFYSWFVSYSDVYHCGREIILDFPCDLQRLDESFGGKLGEINARLMQSLREHSIRRAIPYKATGLVEYDEFYPRLSKPIIDEVDRVLARHYGFSDEELDFIINYDIKYRMGAESSGGGADAGDGEE
ncbi:MAG: Eco57I restriction-modification methylase domain-containing protein, partial [Ktedonobacterales bacterium]